MCSIALPRADKVDDGESLGRVFRLAGYTPTSPKISSFNAFFIFSKSFAQTVGFTGLNPVCSNSSKNEGKEIKDKEKEKGIFSYFFGNNSSSERRDKNTINDSLNKILST